MRAYASVPLPEAAAVLSLSLPGCRFIDVLLWSISIAYRDDETVPISKEGAREPLTRSHGLLQRSGALNQRLLQLTCLHALLPAVPLRAWCRRSRRRPPASNSLSFPCAAGGWSDEITAYMKKLREEEFEWGTLDAAFEVLAEDPGSCRGCNQTAVDAALAVVQQCVLLPGISSFPETLKQTVLGALDESRPGMLLPLAALAAAWLDRRVAPSWPRCSASSSPGSHARSQPSPCLSTMVLPAPPHVLPCRRLKGGAEPAAALQQLLAALLGLRRAAADPAVSKRIEIVTQSMELAALQLAGCAAVAWARCQAQWVPKPPPALWVDGGELAAQPHPGLGGPPTSLDSPCGNCRARRAPSQGMPRVCRPSGSPFPALTAPRKQVCWTSWARRCGTLPPAREGKPSTFSASWHTWPAWRQPA